MIIELKETSRGFKRGEFKDRYGEACSIQESSLATEDCVWLGCERETKNPTTGDSAGARMHLTRGMAVALVTHLQRFIETGRL